MAVSTRSWGSPGSARTALVGVLPREIGEVGAEVGRGGHPAELKRSEVVRRDADRARVGGRGLDDDGQGLAFGELHADELGAGVVSARTGRAARGLTLLPNFHWKALYCADARAARDKTVASERSRMLRGMTGAALTTRTGSLVR